MQALPSAHLSAIVLTEDEVKKRFVPFLKDFYRHRYEPLPNTMEVAFDNVSAGGVVADGRMMFRKPDDTFFTCTYEATSRDKIQEVKYTLNIVYFLWDCAAFAAVLTAAAYIVFYNTRFTWLVGLHWAGNIGLLLGLGTIGFFGWYFTMQHWRKYRFIHAIAQFRQYFADEQWIAVSEDVFPSPVDPYLQELRNQCIYNGFGLAIVPTTGNVRPLVNPSRLSIYGKDRAMVHWLTRAQWYQSVSQSVGVLTKVKPPDAMQVMWNKMTRPLRYLVVDPFKKTVWAALSKPFGQTSSAYTRFMSGQVTQKWIFSVAIILVLPLIYEVLSVREEEIADLEALHNWRSERNPEDQPGYLVDGEAIPYNAEPTGVPKQYPRRVEPPDETPTIDISASNDDSEEQTINLSGDEEAETPKVQPRARYEGIEDEDPPPAKPAAPKAAPKSSAKPVVKPAPADACARFKGKKGWVIQESSFANRNNAEERLDLLQRKKMSAELVARSCLDAGKSGYVLLLGGVFSDENAARRKQSDYAQTYREQGLGKANLLLRKTYPDVRGYKRLPD